MWGVDEAHTPHIFFTFQDVFFSAVIISHLLSGQVPVSDHQENLDRLHQMFNFDIFVWLVGHTSSGGANVDHRDMETIS